MMEVFRQTRVMHEKGWRLAEDGQEAGRSEQEAGVMEVYRQAGGMHKTGWKHAEGSQEAGRSR